MIGIENGRYGIGKELAQGVASNEEEKEIDNNLFLEHDTPCATNKFITCLPCYNGDLKF